MIEYNTLIVLAGGSLLGASAGLVGCFALLRGRALVGDALAHAALPGVCLAFLATGQRSLPPLLAGALGGGLLGIGVLALLRRYTRVKQDAALGIVLSVFFGGGIALGRIIQDRSVAGSKAGLDSFILGKTAGLLLADVYLIAAVALFCLIAVGLLYKEFKLVVFDTGFALAQGWPAGALDVSLMALIALTVVIGLPSAGALLVAALLILPGATARFWTDRLGMMLLLAAVIGCTVGLVGTAASAVFSRLPTGPIIVLAGTVLFAVSLLAAPRRGLLARWIEHRRLRVRLEQRKLLATLYELVEPDLPNRRILGLAELARRRRCTPQQLLRQLRRAAQRGWVAGHTDSAIQLTAAGWAEACRIVRQLRLWDQFLCEHGDLAATLADLDDVSLADKVPSGLLGRLVEQLRAQGRWPEVPEAEGAP